MDSFIFVIVGQAIAIIIAVVAIAWLIIHALSRISKNQTGHKNKGQLFSAIVFSVVAFVMLVIVVFVGQSFFNFPQETDAGIVTTTWPYNLVRVTLAITGLASIILWVRYLRKTR